MFSIHFSFLTIAILPFSMAIIVRYRHNPSSTIPSKRQFQPPALPMPWTVQSEHICPGEGKRQQKCNIHNQLFQCACPFPAGHNGKMAESGHAKCQSVLPHADRPDEQLLTIGVAFPLLEQFREDPERVFLEDLELFTFIPREAILIYKRGCSRDGTAYEFQIGILESTCRHSPAKLRTIHPRIFLSNPFFMHENALKIAYIRQPH